MPKKSINLRTTTSDAVFEKKPKKRIVKFKRKASDYHNDKCDESGDDETIYPREDDADSILPRDYNSDLIPNGETDDNSNMVLLSSPSMNYEEYEDENLNEIEHTYSLFSFFESIETSIHEKDKKSNNGKDSKAREKKQNEYYFDNELEVRKHFYLFIFLSIERINTIGQ